MSETDWAEIVAEKLVVEMRFDTPVRVARAVSNIAAALRKERESTVERCAVWAEAVAKACRSDAGKIDGLDLAALGADRAATAIRALNIPKGD